MTGANPLELCMLHLREDYIYQFKEADRVKSLASQDVPEIFNYVANPSENKLEALIHGIVAVLPKAMELLRRHGREQNEHWST